LRTIYRPLGRKDPPANIESSFRHYFLRNAWWDYDTILLEAYRSLTALVQPIIHLSSATGGNLLIRSITFPILIVLGLLSFLSFVFIALLGVLHLVVVCVLTLVSLPFASVSSASGTSPDRSLPRRVTGIVMLGILIAGPILLFWENARPVPILSSPTVPRSSAPDASKDLKRGHGRL